MNFRSGLPNCAAMQAFTLFANRFPSKVLLDVIAMLVVALIALVAYKLSPAWLSLAEHRLSPPPDCDLINAPCRVVVGNGWMELSISPRPVPIGRPFKIELHTSGLRVQRVDADFSAVGMNMGLHRPQLLAIPNGRYAIETSLPVCSSGPMLWELTLLVETSSGRLLAPFRFTTQGSSTNK